MLVHILGEASLPLRRGTKLALILALGENLPMIQEIFHTGDVVVAKVNDRPASFDQLPRDL